MKLIVLIINRVLKFYVSFFPLSRCSHPFTLDETSMSINLLPKKRWNVWNPENIARIEKDETEYKKNQLEKEKNQISNEQETRLERLRNQALLLQQQQQTFEAKDAVHTSPSLPLSSSTGPRTTASGTFSFETSSSSSISSLQPPQQHINLFQDINSQYLPFQDTYNTTAPTHGIINVTSVTSAGVSIQRNENTLRNRASTNPEYESEKKIIEEQKRKKEGTSIPSDTKLGEGSIELAKVQPWYYTRTTVSSTNAPSITDSNDTHNNNNNTTSSYRREHIRNDPLLKIKIKKQQQQQRITKVNTVPITNDGNIGNKDIMLATGLSSTYMHRSNSSGNNNNNNTVSSSSPSLSSISQLLTSPLPNESTITPILPTLSTVIPPVEKEEIHKHHRKRSNSEDRKSSTGSTSSSSSRSSENRSKHKRRKHYHRHHRHHHHTNNHEDEITKSSHRSHHHRHHRHRQTSITKPESSSSSSHNTAVSSALSTPVVSSSIVTVVSSTETNPSTNVTNIERLRAERLKRETIEADRSQQILLQAAEKGNYGSVGSSSGPRAAIAAHALLRSVQQQTRYEQQSMQSRAREYSDKYFPHLKR